MIVLGIIARLLTKNAFLWTFLFQTYMFFMNLKFAYLTFFIAIIAWFLAFMIHLTIMRSIFFMIKKFLAFITTSFIYYTFL